MAHDDRKLTATVANPAMRERARQCDLISPISPAEMLDDQRLESLCDEACEDMGISAGADDET